MNNIDKVFLWLQDHPRSTVDGIIEALGVNYSSVATAMAEGKREKVIVSEYEKPGSRRLAYTWVGKRLNPDALQKRPVIGKKVSAFIASSAPAEPAQVAAMQPPPGLEAMIAKFAEAFSDMLVDATFKALHPKVTQKLTAAIPALLPELGTDVPSPPKQEGLLFDAVNMGGKRERKLKVCVIGLPPQQIALIRDEFADTFDMHFWSSDGVGEGVGKLKSLGISCDKVYVNVARVAHEHTEILTAIGAPYRKFGGGLTQLRSMLRQLYKETTQ